MRVVLDARMAFHSGIGRYIRNLCRELQRQSTDLTLSLLMDPRGMDGAWQDGGRSHVIPFPAKIYGLSEQFRGSWLCRVYAKQTSLFHFPHYNVPWLLPRNSVVTIHDLTHFLFPQHSARYQVWLAFRLFERGVRRAAHLITVSQATRQALEAVLPEAQGKTTVVYHGVEERFHTLSTAVIEEFRRTVYGGRFLLYVGNTKPHKNLPRLLQAFSLVRARYQNLGLVLLGVESSSTLNHTEGVHNYQYVRDEHLTLWYNAAEALLLPSLNEGFGLPALEAMACGTPVIASNVASLPEVVGDAGILVSPWDVEALAEAIGRLLAEPDLRHDLRQKGLQRAQAFSWARAAEQTLEIYRRVAIS